MANQIFATLDVSEKWLDKQREIDGYSVDGFTVIPCFRGKSVEITFFRFVKPLGYENKCSYEIPTEIRSQCYMKIISKLKKCSFVDGKVIISISGQKYCIGTYREEL